MDLSTKCEAFVFDLAAELKLTGNDEINVVRSNVLKFINESFNKKISYRPGPVSYIAADTATIEVIDAETGLLFRRELPIRYEETGNGVSLIGEDISGKPAQISFLSEAAYERIKDLTGKGPDVPVCENL